MTMIDFFENVKALQHKAPPTQTLQYNTNTKTKQSREASQE